MIDKRKVIRLAAYFGRERADAYLGLPLEAEAPGS
jgi:hypothetical protein